MGRKFGGPCQPEDEIDDDRGMIGKWRAKEEECPVEAFSTAFGPGVFGSVRMGLKVFPSMPRRFPDSPLHDWEAPVIGNIPPEGI